jgi:tetratricopeptide (TPR) repeat protein
VRGIVLGGIGAVAAIAVHSAMDFGLHMPANALLAVFLAALLPNVVALRTRRGSGGGVDLPTFRWALSRRARLVGSLVLVGAVIGIALAQAPPALADIYVQRATALAGGKARAKGAVSMRDYHSALQDLGEAVRLDPGNPSVHDGVAEVAGELGLWIWRYGVAPDGRRLGPSSDERVNASQGYLAQAYAAHRQSLAINPRSPWAHDRFGRFLGNLEAIRQVIRGSSALRVTLDPRLAPLVDAEASLIPDALAHMREGVRLDPMNVYRHRNLAVFALTHPIGPDSSRVATDGFRAALSLDAEFLDEVAERLELRGPGGLAILRASMPRDSALWLRLAHRWERRGRGDDARSAYEEALSLTAGTGEQARVRLAYSEFLVNSGNAKAALALVRAVLVDFPRDHRVYRALAAAYDGLQRPAEAEEALASALSLAGTSDPAARREYRLLLAQNYQKRGQTERAIAIYREVLKEAPDDYFSHGSLAAALDRHGRPEEAIQEYRASERFAPHHPGVRYQAGLVFAREGLLRDAASSFEAAVAVKPDWQSARLQLAGVYTRLGERERAREQYMQILTHDPRHEEARRALAGIDDPSTATGKR